jgi:hypothetical protein
MDRLLGFPATEAAVRIFWKTAFQEITISCLLYLKDSMQEPRVIKLLGHLPRINGGVIRVIADPELSPHTSYSFLEEVAQDKSQKSMPWMPSLMRAANFWSLYRCPYPL